MGRAAAHDMCAVYGPLPPAHEAAHVFSRAGPDRGPRDEVYYCYYYHYSSTKSTLPVRRPMCFHGPARAVAHAM